MQTGAWICLTEIYPSSEHFVQLPQPTVERKSCSQPVAEAPQGSRIASEGQIEPGAWPEPGESEAEDSYSLSNTKVSRDHSIQRHLSRTLNTSRYMNQQKDWGDQSCFLLEISGFWKIWKILKV